MKEDDGSVYCERCGQLLSVGVFPFCPHDSVRTFNIKRDEYPGGITLENYGPQPVTFYTESERLGYMKRHDLQQTEKFAAFPGTDRDPSGIQNPRGYVDAQTLENARILISRNGQGSPEKEWDPQEAGVLRNLSSETVEDAGRVKDATK